MMTIMPSFPVTPLKMPKVTQCNAPQLSGENTNVVFDGVYMHQLVNGIKLYDTSTLALVLIGEGRKVQMATRLIPSLHKTLQRLYL